MNSEKPKILVIDDEEWLREMIKLALNSKGYEVLEADNGKKGIEFARKLMPDLILCDINMGKLDGFQTLSKIRSQSTLDQTPFLLMSGLVSLEGMQLALTQGADGYLAKPFTIDELFKTVAERIAAGREPRQAQQVSRASISKRNITWTDEASVALNGILAYGGLLADASESFTPIELAEMGRIISNAGESLQQLVNAHENQAYSDSREGRERQMPAKLERFGSSSSQNQPLGLCASQTDSNDPLKFVVASVLHDLKGEFAGLGFVIKDIKDVDRHTSKGESIYKRLSAHIRHVEAHLKLIEAFIETGMPLTDSVDVIQTLSEIETLCANRLPRNVSFHLALPTGKKTWEILGNKDLFIGICRELIRNAGTAMAAKGGRLAMSFKPTTDGVEIHIEDTGPGFPAKIRRRVFTQPVGESPRTGWGLYLAQRVATAMGGLIKLKATSKAGSVIMLWFQRPRK